MSDRVSLQPVDAAHVTILVDNFIDALLPSSEVAQRPQVAYEMWEREREQLIAEHARLVRTTPLTPGHKHNRE